MQFLHRRTSLKTPSALEVELDGRRRVQYTERSEKEANTRAVRGGAADFREDLRYVSAAQELSRSLTVTLRFVAHCVLAPAAVTSVGGRQSMYECGRSRSSQAKRSIVRPSATQTSWRSWRISNICSHPYVRP